MSNNLFDRCMRTLATGSAITKAISLQLVRNSIEHFRCRKVDFLEHKPIIIDTNHDLQHNLGQGISSTVNRVSPRFSSTFNESGAMLNCGPLGSITVNTAFDSIELFDSGSNAVRMSGEYGSEVKSLMGSPTKGDDR